MNGRHDEAWRAMYLEKLGGYSHAAQRFWEAVDALASGTEPIQRRLGHAAERVATGGLREDGVPPGLRARYRDLVAKLTGGATGAGESSAKDACREMSDAAASAAAKEIVSLALVLAPRFAPSDFFTENDG